MENRKKRKAEDCFSEESKKSKTDLSDSDQKDFYNWSSSSAESEGEIFVDPLILGASYKNANVSETDFKKLFASIGEPLVSLRKKEKQAALKFQSLEETQAAVKLSGTDLLGHPVYLARQPSGVETLCITGFNPEKSQGYLIRKFRKKLKKCGSIELFCIPRDSSKSYLGFCYLYIRKSVDDLLSALKSVDPKMGDFVIQISVVNLKKWVNNAITENMPGIIVQKIEALKNAIEETFQRSEGDEETDQDVFSWSNRPDLFPYYRQEANECWAIVLYRGQFAARKLHGSSSSSSKLSVPTIVDGVHPRHLLTGRGIDRVKNAKPFMKNHVKDMVIHHRPKTFDNEDLLAYYANTIQLGKKLPVAVMINCLPSYNTWDGQGIYTPSVLEICRSFMEKDQCHGLMLAGVGFENGKKFCEFRDSFGLDWGDSGFIKMVYPNYLIKQVIEFTV